MKTPEDIIKEVSPYYKKKGGPEEDHELIYDSASESLEPVYFFILDLFRKKGYDVDKIVDNFTSSPGSGHFSELQGKATQMQQTADQTMKTIYSIVRGIIQIVYDLKDFKMRLQHYDDLKSEDKGKSEAARLALKQVWLDKVDIQRGNSSIAMMARQLGFQTLFDAFYVAKDEKDVDKLDLNERVKRLVKQRIHDFNIWLKESENHLRDRYKIQRNYLKNQANTLNMFSRWVKPYLKAAQRLEQKDQGTSPDVVNAFNTIVFELTLFGKSKLKIKESAISGELPSDFQKKSIQNKVRDYYKCLLITFEFRGMPSRNPQGGHYSFGGKTHVKFKGYSLNEDEIKKFEQEVKKSDLEEVMNLIKGATEDSLGEIKKDLDYFLKEEEREEEKKQKKQEQKNPFLALFGKYEKKSKTQNNKNKKPKKDTDKLNKDNWFEKNYLRPLMAKKAGEATFDIFNIYKKAHGMPNYNVD
ncbi:MAG: hypothetical protein ACOC3Z_00090 [Nanoarchaeota archaeon]